MADGPRRERKVVSVVFCDLVGFTQRAEALDPEDVEAFLGPYHQRLRSEFVRYGGTVEKFIGDAVMALFGAPVAHEDDPERAVRVALAIRDWAQGSEEIQVRLAVTTGEALVRLDARPESGEGMASGDVVNTAARLQTAAPVNGILVDETTYRATRHVIEHVEAEPVEAKGKTEPISVWQPRAARTRFGVDVAHAARAELVGRDRELGILRDAFARAVREGIPQLVTLVGVPGIGKSRLVYELSRIAQDDEELITWRQGRCLAYGEGVTLWALGEILKAQAGILEQDAPPDVEEKIRATADALLDEKDARWVESHLLALVGLAGDRELGGDRRDETFAAWRRFLEALAEVRPLVLVFEDLHWADDNLLDFIDQLASSARAATRSTPSSSRISSWSKELHGSSPSPRRFRASSRLVSTASRRTRRAFSRTPPWSGRCSGRAASTARRRRKRTPCPRAEGFRAPPAPLVGGGRERVRVRARARARRRLRADSASRALRDAQAHRRVDRVPRAPEDHAEMLAYHWGSALALARAARRDGGELVDKTRGALRAAGDRAFALNAFAPAASYYAQALELWPPEAPGRPQLLFRRAHALQIADDDRVHDRQQPRSGEVPQRKASRGGRALSRGVPGRRAVR